MLMLRLTSLLLLFSLSHSACSCSHEDMAFYQLQELKPLKLTLLGHSNPAPYMVKGRIRIQIYIVGQKKDTNLHYCGIIWCVVGLALAVASEQDNSDHVMPA